MGMNPKQFVMENLERVLKLINPRAILYECARGACFLTVIRYQILWLFHMKHSQLRIRLNVGMRQVKVRTGASVYLLNS